MNTDTKKRHAVAGEGSSPRTGNPVPNGCTETAANGSGYNFPNSKRIYVGAELHRDIGVPFFVIPSEVEGSLDISVRL